MTKRTWIIAGTAALATLGTAAGIAAPTATADQSGSTITVFEHQTEFNAIAQSSSAATVDDSFALSSDLYDNTNRTVHVGYAGVSCVQTSITRGNQGQVECNFTMVFTGGQITATGLVDLASATTAKGRFTMPVVGGTGRYRDANGEVSVLTLNQTDSVDTIALD